MLITLSDIEIVYDIIQILDNWYHKAFVLVDNTIRQWTLDVSKSKSIPNY